MVLPVIYIFQENTLTVFVSSNVVVSKDHSQNIQSCVSKTQSLWNKIEVSIAVM